MNAIPLATNRRSVLVISLNRNVTDRSARTLPRATGPTPLGQRVRVCPALPGPVPRAHRDEDRRRPRERLRVSGGPDRWSGPLTASFPPPWSELASGARAKWQTAGHRSAGNRRTSFRSCRSPDRRTSFRLRSSSVCAPRSDERGGRGVRGGSAQGGCPSPSWRREHRRDRRPARSHRSVGPLVTANGGTHGTLSVLLGTGDGTFGHCCIGCRRRHQRHSRMRSHRYHHPHPAPRSAFAGYRFPPEVITLAVRWYLRFGLSYRDVEELLAERGVEVDHVSIYRWVQRFAPDFAEAARARQHVVGDRWQLDETYLKIGGTWRYLFRAIDQFGQVIDVYLSPRRDAKAARQFFDRAIGRTRVSPVEVTTDRYRVYSRVL